MKKSHPPPPLPLSSPPGSAALATPIPNLPHALSVSLPTWVDNVDWAEGNPRVVDAMSSGYPRFFVHRNIQKLAELCLHASGKQENDMALLFPTARTAQECILYMNRTEGRSAPRLVQVEVQVQDEAAIADGGVELVAVSFAKEFWKIAKSFWQHAGMGISSRYADMVLGRLAAGGKLVEVEQPMKSPLNFAPKALEEKRILRHRIADMINCNRNQSTIPPGGCELGNIPAEEDHVFLYPTGMSAIWHAHQLTLAFQPRRKCVCFGFSYTDTIKIIDRWGSGSPTFFFDSPDKNLQQLEESLPSCPISALFCEVPSNPLLQTPNLPRLRALADKHGFLVVVDETVGNFVNVDVFRYADIVTTSLSKLFSGSANVMGGSLVINPNSTHFDFMRAHLRKTFVDDYYYEDAVVMEENSRDFLERVGVINANAVAVCEFLRSRTEAFAARELRVPPSDLLLCRNDDDDDDGDHHQHHYHGKNRFVIKNVFFPKWVTRENYGFCRKPIGSGRESRGRGRGAIITATADGGDDIDANDTNDGNDVDVDNFGPLCSITFTSPEASHAFFDALQCAKGPSLGTNFTLACPYTILAHYNERPWAATYGIEEGIVRISVGMEERGLLMSWIRTALDEAEKCLLLHSAELEK